MKDGIIDTSEYQKFIADLKARVMAARISASRAVNCEQLLLYWDIGQSIVEKQRIHNWGDGVVEAVAADLRTAFPGTTGFSARNVWGMRRLFQSYSDPEILRQAAAVFDSPLTDKKQRGWTFVSRGEAERSMTQTRINDLYNPKGLAQKHD